MLKHIADVLTGGGCGSVVSSRGKVKTRLVFVIRMLSTPLMSRNLLTIRDLRHDRACKHKETEANLRLDKGNLAISVKPTDHA